MGATKICLGHISSTCGPFWRGSMAAHPQKKPENSGGRLIADHIPTIVGIHASPRLLVISINYLRFLISAYLIYLLHSTALLDSVSQLWRRRPKCWHDSRQLACCSAGRPAVVFHETLATQLPVSTNVSWKMPITIYQYLPINKI